MSQKKIKCVDTEDLLNWIETLVDDGASFDVIASNNEILNIYGMSQETQKMLNDRNAIDKKSQYRSLFDEVV